MSANACGPCMLLRAPSQWCQSPSWRPLALRLPPRCMTLLAESRRGVCNIKYTQYAMLVGKQHFQQRGLLCRSWTARVATPGRSRSAAVQLNRCTPAQGDKYGCCSVHAPHGRAPALTATPCRSGRCPSPLIRHQYQFTPFDAQFGQSCRACEHETVYTRFLKRERGLAGPYIKLSSTSTTMLAARQASAVYPAQQRLGQPSQRRRPPPVCRANYRWSAGEGKARK